MFNFSSESQKALIGQPWTVPWALITPAAKTGLGLGLGRGAGFVRDTSMVTQHPYTEGNFNLKFNAMIVNSSRSSSKNFIYVLRIFFIFARRK